MSKYSLKFILAILKGLMSVKRALTFLFLSLAGFLESLGRFLAAVIIFPFYKFYLFTKEQLERRLGAVDLSFLSLLAQRRVLYGLILLITLLLAGSQTSAYASSKYLSGRHSLLFSYLGPGEEGEVVEEGIIDATKVTQSLDWSQGSIVSIPQATGFEGELEDLAGLILADSALLQPTILPGVEIGGRRSEIIKYIVQPGDNLGSLAQKFQISLETILIENRLLARTILRPGDILSILPVSGLSHKVKKGETFKKIASLYKADMQRVVDFNHLTSEELAVGEVLIIPEGRRPPAPAPVYRPTVAGRPQGVRASGSGMLWPTITRRITQYFGWRHLGIDIALPAGNPVYAADSGMVEVAGWNRGGYGYQVVINHGNNIKTRYAHNSRNFVKVSETVNKGDVIALIGSTGRSTGPHLHFEVIVGGVRVNPFMYVR